MSVDAFTVSGVEQSTGFTAGPKVLLNIWSLLKLQTHPRAAPPPFPLVVSLSLQAVSRSGQTCAQQEKPRRPPHPHPPVLHPDGVVLVI